MAKLIASMASLLCSEDAAMITLGDGCVEELVAKYMITRLRLMAAKKHMFCAMYY